MLHGRPVSVELASEALSDLVSPSMSVREPATILDAVARHFGVSVEALRGKARHKEIVAPRHLAMYLLREDARLSYPQIGTLMGGRDHTSVLHAYEKIALDVERSGRSIVDARAIRDGLT
jgi:chromosomal replication initiator protein